MGGLGLVPNEIVGWRIKPDWYNFTVVLVKRFGATSKRAGQEYEEAQAYCKTLSQATAWLIQHVTRVQAEKNQCVVEAATGSIASAEALHEAVRFATAAALAAVAELDARLTARGLSTAKQITHFLGDPSGEESAA